MCYVVWLPIFIVYNLLLKFYIHQIPSNTKISINLILRILFLWLTITDEHSRNIIIFWIRKFIKNWINFKQFTNWIRDKFHFSAFFLFVLVLDPFGVRSSVCLLADFFITRAMRITEPDFSSCLIMLVIFSYQKLRLSIKSKNKIK